MFNTSSFHVIGYCQYVNVLLPLLFHSPALGGVVLTTGLDAHGYLVCVLAVYPVSLYLESQLHEPIHFLFAYATLSWISVTVKQRGLTNVPRKPCSRSLWLLVKWRE